MQKVLLAVLVGNVTLRFFTNYLNVLPRIFNIADLFLVTLMALLFVLGGRDPQPSKRGFGKFTRRLLLFNVIAIVGTLLNTQYIYPLSSFSQLLMWNEPIVLFLLLSHARLSMADVEQFMRVLVRLLKLELFIGFIQVFQYLKTGDSEEILGTFHHNAEQYQAFVLIGVYYLIGRLESRDTQRRTRNKIAIVAILALVILIDNKASWLATALTLGYILTTMPTLGLHVRSRAKYLTAFAVIVIFGYLAVIFTSTSLVKYSHVFEAWDTGNLLNIGKIKAYEDVMDAYWEHPHMILFGSGLGTFYSRAAWQFIPPKIQEIYSQPFEPTKQALSESNSMQGVITPVTNIEPFYRQFYRDRKIFQIFSGTADQPVSTYVSLLGETGVIASLIYVWFYLSTLKQLKELLRTFGHDVFIFPFAVASMGFLIYLMCMGTYNFWLEDARLSTILWGMIAMVFKYAELKRGDANDRPYKPMPALVKSNAPIPRQVLPQPQETWVHRNQVFARGLEGRRFKG